MNINISFTGLDELRARLAQNLTPHIAPGLYALAAEIQNVLAPYPPETIRNSPANPRGRWYERGYGYRSRTGRSWQTSEFLGRSWGIVTPRMERVVLFNRASYAPFVQSAAFQAQVMAQIGWKTDRWAIAKVMASDAIDRIIVSIIRRVLR